MPHSEITMRTFAIGDIHGGLKALKQVLERAEVTKNDRLIFLGDYVDGWSDSANVISYLINLSQDHDCIFIKGNHDDLVAYWLRTRKKYDQWLEHGGRSTLKAYEDFTETEIKEHLHFLENTKNYYINEENRLFLHAGFANIHGPAQEYEDYVFYWDRTLWEMALALDKNLEEDDIFYPKRLKLFKEIFIGHTPTTRINKENPVNAANVWNVDTGAAFKGKLSMINVESKKVYQSEPVYQLYPDEKGRN